jgi:two-component system, NtrC family, response regulator HydG
MSEVDMTTQQEKEKILVVDDSRATLEVVQRNLFSEGYTVYSASGVTEAVRVLESFPVDLVITDYKMPDVDGLDLVKYVREKYKMTEVMMITGYASVQGAVEAVKAGAEEYLSKPFTDRELFSAVKRVLEKLHVKRAASKDPQEPVNPHGLIGESEAMKKILGVISRAARTSATVLISGESGTGKELAARAIHYNSSRLSAPFVPINCSAIPEELLESSLFGHVKGSFTGATDSRAGFFQTADGGTIFLDEISNTSLAMQAKLLRVLQDREICMVGASKPQKVDVRILSATNKDLMSMVKTSGFREDLFYRLNVIPIMLPPLRERENDVILLANHFLSRFARETCKSSPSFSEKVLQIFKSYSWPGNVRELENLVQRLVVMVDSNVIDVPDLPAHMHFSNLSGVNVHRTLEEVEREHILNVLNGVGGNKTRAAEILNIDRKTLRVKLEKIDK